MNMLNLMQYKRLDDTLIVFHDYKYNKKVENKDNTFYYKCRVGTCSASLTIDNDVNVLKINSKVYTNIAETDEARLVNLKNFVERSHATHEKCTALDCKVYDTLNTMRKRCESESTTPYEIYNSEQSKLLRSVGDTSLVAQSLPNMVNLKTSLYNHKHVNYPKMPKQLHDLVLNEG